MEEIEGIHQKQGEATFGLGFKPGNRCGIGGLRLRLGVEAAAVSCRDAGAREGDDHRTAACKACQVPDPFFLMETDLPKKVPFGFQQ